MGVVECVGGIIISEDRKRVLAVMPEWTDIYLLPGGKIEVDETSEQCLFREIEREELNGVKIIRYDYFIRYDDLGKALFDEGRLVMDTYIIVIEGIPRPSAEIKKLAWMSDEDRLEKRVKLASGFDYFMPDLKETGLLLGEGKK